MKFFLLWASACLSLFSLLASNSRLAAQESPFTNPVVKAPPEKYFETIREADRDAARAFYTKHVDIGGVHCTAATVVDDQALLRTHDIVTHMLAGRPDVLKTMAEFGTRLIIIGKDQVYTDMPEYRRHPNPTFQNERVRGTGGLDVTSFGEENLLNLAQDRYDDESIAVHEFCHTIDSALTRMDAGWRQRKNATYQQAVDKGLYKYAYAGSNAAEYWAEICQAYFDCNRVNNWNHGPVGTREQLQEYDPVGFELVRSTFRLAPDQDWRFKPLQSQPSVQPPPDRFHFDPFYTKFTWARELPILGSAMVDDQALLKANIIVRKMFAYRHDLLKAIINDGGRIVVLARDQSLADLPELAGDADLTSGAQARIFAYDALKKMIVVPEECLLEPESAKWQGKCWLIGLLARAIVVVAAAREFDERFEKVRRDSQQYEQRLIWNQPPEIIVRLDKRFETTLRDKAVQAMEQGLWRGTPAARNATEYWVAGIEAYFDATGRGYVPMDANWPINTRKSLEKYDPELYKLVHETMLYAGRQDWRVESR